MATLHYASGGSATEIATAGFNLADVQYVSQVNALPDGMKGLVYLNEHEGVTSSFIEKMTPFLGNPNVFGFYLVDEPDPTGRWGTYATAENLKAESDWIHEHFPGAKTFITMMNMGSPTNPDFTNTYNPANTHIDYFGIDPYPVRTGTDTVDYDMIDRAVAAAVKSGIPANNIVPVYQAFGGGNWETSDGGRHVMPTPEQMQTMIDHWAALVPTPGFDYTYKWGTQNGDTALESSSELQAVFREHNLATTGAEPSDTSDGSAAATPPSDAAASDSSSTVTAPSHDATGDNTSTATAPSHDATGDISSTATAPSDATASDSSSTATAPSHDATGDISSTATAPSHDATGDSSSTAAASSEAATGDSSSTATVPSTATAADNSSTVAASDSKTSHGTSTATATAIAPSDASTSDSNSAGAATSHRTASHGKATSDASHASASTDEMAGHSGNDTSHVDTGGNKMDDLGSGVDRVLAVLSHALSAGSEFLATNNHSDRTATNLTGHGFAQTVQSGENVGAQAKNGAAAEIMSGHGGNDAFDFSKLQDKLHLDQAALAELKSGGLSLHASPAGTATDDGSHHIIFDSSTGSLSLDSDAVGGAAQAQLATHLPWQHHSLI
ncbi:calcium-binding protein [Mesorhizobium sp. M0909]|uniref:calcium-binding protein n=2 Tax=unclassified Mesorhizobium TaxID=325217 RepID=UPI00333A1627